MIVPRAIDTKHKFQMYRLLREILKQPKLANYLMFKGGTCAALRGVLDRFSVDLDFDLSEKKRKKYVRSELYLIFEKLDLYVKDESKKHLQFFLRYKASENERNTLKLEINDDITEYDEYEKVFLREIQMYCNSQTLGTMFANKLFASKARFIKTGRIAGRDFYDIRSFFVQGLPIKKEIIEYRSKMKYRDFIADLVNFVDTNINEKVLTEDLNLLIPERSIKKGLSNIKQDVLYFLRMELSMG